MVKTLFKRELFSSPILARKGRERILPILSTLFFVALFVALIGFVYSRLYNQLAIYATFNRSFYTIVLFAILLLGLIYALPTMHKSFFGDEKERIILGSRPVKRRDILLSKSLFAFLRNALFLVVTYLPLSLVYGIESGAPAGFYVLLIVLLPFVDFFLTGFAGILLIPYREVYRLLKKHPLLAFLLTIAVSFLLAYVYSLFLDLFVSLIQNASLDSLFTTERMQAMTNVSKGLVPASFLSDVVLLENGLSFLYLLLMTIAVLAIAFFLLLPYLEAYYRQKQGKDKGKDYLLVPVVLESPFKALVKKELSLVFSRSDGFFSYISLVAVEPFLIYLVVSAINVIFSTGNFTFIQTLFPDFLLLVDALLILLFLSVINATSSLSLSKEGRNIQTMKTIPIAPIKQILVKMLVPYLFSSLSYLIALIVLVATGEIHWISFLFLIPIGLVFLLVLSFSTIHLDMRQKKSHVLNLLVDFLLPVLFLLLSFVLTLFEPFSSQAYLSFYLSSLILLLLIAIPLVLLFFKKGDRLFLLYEGGGNA